MDGSEVDIADDVARATFICETRRNLKATARLRDGSEHTFEFKQGQLMLEGELLSEFAQILRHPKSKRLRELIREISPETARALVAKHRAQHQRPGAAKGAFTTAAFEGMRESLLEGGSVEGGGPEGLANVAHALAKAQVAAAAKPEVTSAPLPAPKT